MAGLITKKSAEAAISFSGNPDEERSGFGGEIAFASEILRAESKLFEAEMLAFFSGL
jgi:hypothetical protein